MQFSKLIEQKKTAILEEISKKQAALNDLDGIERLYRLGILNDSEVRRSLLDGQDGLNASTAERVERPQNTPTPTSDAGAARPTIVSLIRLAVAQQNGVFTMPDVLATLRRDTPGVDFKKGTVFTYLERFFQEGKLYKSSAIPGQLNQYRLSSQEDAHFNLSENGNGRKAEEGARS